MPISEKTRKILWGRSGNLCAHCRKTLVAEKMDEDDASVLGEECHIVSGAPHGPRYDASFPLDLIDHLDNLILLCATHHKLVDDQLASNSSTVLRTLKASHENWVESRLKDDQKPDHVGFHRFKSNIPKHLSRVKSGRVLLETASPCAGAYQYYPDDLSDEEIEMVGGFIGNVRDWNDIFDEIEPIEQMRAKKSLTDEIAHLGENGFLVFSAVEKQRLEGGKSGPTDWYMLHISVVRSTDPSIIPTLDADAILAILKDHQDSVSSTEPEKPGRTPA